MKLEFSQKIFDKTLKFLEIYSMGTKLLHASGCRTDRHDETKSRFSQFFERPRNCAMK